MSYTRLIQECSCGSDTYHIQSLLSDTDVMILCSCSECGRITGSVGTVGRNRYIGMDIQEVLDE